MVLRRCPKCGGTNDDKYGFCLKCGYEYPDKKNVDIAQQANESENPNRCIACGYENPDEATYCVKCGMPLFLKQEFESNGPFIIKYEASEPKKEEPKDYKPTSSIVIVLGYIFSIMGGLIGLIIAIYLSTRKDPRARRHGHIQLGILVFYLIIIAIAISTGVVSLDQLSNMTQMNMTSMPGLGDKI